MKIKIITASHRANSNSKKIGEYLKAKLDKEGELDSSVLCLYEKNLPLWNEDKWNPMSQQWKDHWEDLSKDLTSCDGFIFVIPEYSGMMPAILSNFFLLCEKYELAHKAALITTVSAGNSGAYPIGEIRNYSYKNTKVCYIPEQLIFRNVNNFLNEEYDGKDKAYLEERVDYTLPLFTNYVKALSTVANSKQAETDKFKFGM